MSLVELILIAFGLSMDAFAVAVCKGLSMKAASVKKSVIIGLYFGGFQALMPTLGYILGAQFEAVIKAYDHWIIFGLLLVIGGNMIKESRSEETEENSDSASVAVLVMIPLALATSIDALAVGVSFAFLAVPLFSSVITIGITTFICSIIGVRVGNVFGIRYKSRAELTGGIVLILIGTEILLEHLELLPW